MTRVKRGTTSVKRRRNILKQTKGYHLGRKSKEKEAKQAIIKAGTHALQHRRKKKGVFRRLWQIKINAGTRQEGLSYSKFIDKLTKKNIKLNRKMLSELAQHHPKIFSQVVEEAKSENAPVKLTEKAITEKVQ